MALVRYLKTTAMFAADAPLDISESVRIRRIRDNEVENMKSALMKRNVFSRHSWDRDFYVQRASNLAGETVVELFEPGQPSTVVDTCRLKSGLIERIALACAVLVMNRKVIHRKLSISNKLASEFDIAIAGDFSHVKTQQWALSAPSGIAIDRRFSNRFHRLGFVTLVDFAFSRDSNLAHRCCRALEWLTDSRLEPMFTSAIAKTSVAFETLLIGSRTEPLASSLSERSAFILADESNQRGAIAKLVKSFYKLRSEVVHGRSNPVISKEHQNLLEAADRLLVLLLLTIAKNRIALRLFQDVAAFCVKSRWGDDTIKINRPFTAQQLNRCFQLAGIDP